MLTIGASSVASQIADLINSGHQLLIKLSSHSVLGSQIKYIVELDEDKVIGVIGLEQQKINVTELKHLCVHPDYRNKGIGKKLLECGIRSATTRCVYGQVGADNITNIKNNIKVGMRPIGKKMGHGRYIIIFARDKNERLFRAKAA